MTPKFQVTSVEEKATVLSLHVSAVAAYLKTSFDTFTDANITSSGRRLLVSGRYPVAQLHLRSTRFNLFGIDFPGPCPQSRCGNHYVLVAIDYLTKLLKALAVPHPPADFLEEFIEVIIVLIHGTPRSIISDRVTPSMSHHFRKCLARHDERHPPTSL